MQPALNISAREKKPARKFPLSFLIAGLVILGAIIYLVYANTQANAVYYMTVSELKHCSTCASQSVRVAGIVQAGSVVRDDQKHLITFTVIDGNQTMNVAYSGVVPDIFRPGIQVVVEGRYSGQGPFQA
ncbi:MAG: cytochrome c maturation protein CcmE, partial [Ktedonobacteraceae bacterium]|nr:cytochrome c maturation protein CcmE [Ktedonobacteraceae bacterium]